MCTCAHPLTALYCLALLPVIVDAPDDYDIPPEIKALPEIQMVFQHLNLQDLWEIALKSRDNVTNWGDPNPGDPALNFAMTNATTNLTSNYEF